MVGINTSPTIIGQRPTGLGKTKEHLSSDKKGEGTDEQLRKDVQVAVQTIVQNGLTVDQYSDIKNPRLRLFLRGEIDDEGNLKTSSVSMANSGDKIFSLSHELTHVL